jgi:hypothetical protein
MHRASVVPHEEVVEFVRARRLHGRGAGWIDVHLLASAVVSGLGFWTTDAKAATLAAELGVAFRAAP